MARLKEKVPELKWIDLDLGQIDEPSERPPVRLPCALIGIDIPRVRDITDRHQDCEATIVVRLAFDKPGRTGAQTDDQIRAESLRVYDVIAEVYSALQGFETPDFYPLTRTRQNKENSRNGLFTYQIQFKTDFTDEPDKAMK